MSRIRTIKPEFWTSEQVLSCSPLARLLFIGLWNFCDDHGVHQASYVRVKAEVFPGDNFTIKEMKTWVGELISNELLREYVVEGKTYWIVTGWSKHQRIDKPTYRHPYPLSDLKKIDEDNSSNIQRGIDESSPRSQLFLNVLSTTDRNGKEGNGNEKDICEVETSPVCGSDPKSSSNIDEVFSHWQRIMNHPRAKLDKKRQAKIQQALRAGYSVDDLKQAIDGCAKTPYNMGQNDSAQKFDDISLILRDAEHIERFMNNNINPPSNLKGNEVTITTDLMAGVI